MTVPDYNEDREGWLAHYEKNLMKKNELWEVVDHELVNLGTTLDSFDTPQKALDFLIEMYQRIATDPKVNGGFRLVKLEDEC